MRERFTSEKFNSAEMEPALNAVVSHRNFPETLMRECSPGIEEMFLYGETSFRRIPYRLRKIFDSFFF